ncbi:MAG TPA: type II secretion system protein GspM [Hyphomonadaceae bacterium]|nr:type II secretion system protein GspM [Hyphomonadaceae bacterium]HPN04305.1 type II secretion system protein GspM [Hyphomonadaceae bacterium]
MSDSLVSWFNSRTGREQLFLKVAAFVIVGGGALLFAYQAAAAYRETSSADLSSALQMRDDLARLRSLEGSVAATPVPTSDGSVRGIVVAVANQFGLAPARIEPDGPTSIRATFEPIDAKYVYQWLDTVERAGLIVSRISLVRVGEGDIVGAEATIASR